MGYCSLKRGFPAVAPFPELEQESLLNLLLQVEERSDITAHTATAAPLLLAADAGLST